MISVLTFLPLRKINLVFWFEKKKFHELATADTADVLNPKQALKIQCLRNYIKIQ